MNLSVLRRSVNQQHFNRLWQTAWEGAVHTDRKCPSCQKPMVEVPLMPPPDPLVLDVCRSCQFVWFDASELEKIPAAPPQPTAEEQLRTLPPEARQMIALQKVQQMAAQQRREETSTSPQHSVWLDVLPAIVDLIT